MVVVVVVTAFLVLIGLLITHYQDYLSIVVIRLAFLVTIPFVLECLSTMFLLSYFLSLELKLIYLGLLRLGCFRRCGFSAFIPSFLVHYACDVLNVSSNVFIS